MKKVSFSKAKHLLVKTVFRYRKQKAKLGEGVREQIEKDIVALHNSLEGGRGNKEEISESAHNLDETSERLMPKSFLEKVWQAIGPVLVALVFAIAIRQTWFELYYVPTGSMRPTMHEKDAIFFSKDAFSINIPLMLGHFTFNDHDFKRLSVILFSGEGMPIPNNHTLYFWLFPGVKQYLKRLIAKGGDTVYFYGGKIYALDSKGEDLKELRDSPYIGRIDHVPYLYAEGRQSAAGAYDRPCFVFSQMHEAVMRAAVRGSSTVDAEVFDGKHWRRPSMESKPYPTQYRELWGLGNYAKARLVEKEGRLFLKVYTLPNLVQSAWKINHVGHVPYPMLITNTSEIALDEKHIDRLMDTMYTARFVVKDGKASAYDYQGQRSSFSPDFPNVADGTYELYYGKLYQVGFMGNLTELKAPHPLLSRSKENVMRLFNLGISFNTQAAKEESGQVPMRFAYFREGDLHVMGGKVFDKADKELQDFVLDQKERAKKEGIASAFSPFIDLGPPLDSAGNIKKEFIKNFGLKIPEGHMLVLGDNYAMSADSRIFGFVPKKNFRAKAEFTFWPKSNIGFFSQPKIPFFTATRAVVWALVILVISALYMIRRSRHKKAARLINQDFS